MDSLARPNAVSGNQASIGAARAGQEVQKAMIAKLLNALPQQDKAQTPSRSVDRVEISAEGKRRLAAEEAAQG